MHLKSSLLTCICRAHDGVGDLECGGTDTVDFKNGYNIEQLIFILRPAAAGGEEKIVIP